MFSLQLELSLLLGSPPKFLLPCQLGIQRLPEEVSSVSEACSPPKAHSEGHPPSFSPLSPRIPTLQF